MADYLKTALIVSAINKKASKELADQVFSCMFGEFNKAKGEDVEEMQDKLNDFVANYVVAVKEEKTSTPIGNIIKGQGRG